MENILCVTDIHITPSALDHIEYHEWYDTQVVSANGSCGKIIIREFRSKLNVEISGITENGKNVSMKLCGVDDCILKYEGEEIYER